jgi:hypothetical protein
LYRKNGADFGTGPVIVRNIVEHTPLMGPSLQPRSQQRFDRKINRKKINSMALKPLAAKH